MAEQEQQQEQAAKDVEHADVEEEEEDNPNYKPPAPKKLDDIVNQDQDDESLVKYKQALLGQGSKDIIHGMFFLATPIFQMPLAISVSTICLFFP